ARRGEDKLQSYLIPLSFTTADQRSASLRMKVENSAGVVGGGNSPGASALALRAGSANPLPTSACSLSTTAEGVPLGATRPSQTEISSRSGSAAWMFGTPGTGGRRGGRKS